MGWSVLCVEVEFEQEIKKMKNKIGTAVLRRTAKLRPGEHFCPKRGHRLPMVFVTEKKVHVRLHDPKRYSKFRTKDVGRPGMTMMRFGYNSKTKQWDVTSWIFDKFDLVKNIKTRRMFRHIIEQR